MLLSEVVASLDRVLVQFTLTMLSVVEMNPGLLTAAIQGSTTVPIQKMLESSAELSVSGYLAINAY